MCRNLILALALAGSIESLHAESVFPNSLPSRLWGISQWASPSCESEAQAQAVEQVFSNRGQKILISPLHRHWKVWGDERDLGKPNLPPFNEADRAILANSASMIPDYMWPAGDFKQDWSLGQRPRISEASIIDSSFPKDGEIGFKIEDFTFQTQDDGNTYGNNGRDIQGLISSVRNKEAVILSVHGALFGHFVDHNTGLMLPGAYSISALTEKVKAEEESLPSGRQAKARYEYLKAAQLGKEGIWTNESLSGDIFEIGQNHAVAVVGYLEGIYAGQYTNPDAFIVRNSWNDENTVNNSYAMTPNDELEKFRYPLYRAMAPGGQVLNLPGYYAIPVSYIEDMINYRHSNLPNKLGVGGYRKISMNWNVFADAYNRLAGSYSVKKIPFACTNESKFYAAQGKLSSFESFMASGDSFQKKLALQSASGEAVIGGFGTFRLATLTTQNGNESIVDKFLAGDFNAYYCSDSSEPGATYGSVWPGAITKSNPSIWNAIDQISSLPESSFSWVSFFNAMNADPSI